MLKHKNYSGFTLIEIIVVVAIIGILLGIATASYGNSLRHGRDQKRIVNVETIRSNLELFKSSQVAGVYPANLTVYTNAGYTLPPDPQNIANPYDYQPRNSTGGTCNNVAPNYCSTYTLSTNLEAMGSQYVVTPSTSTITNNPIVRLIIAWVSQRV